MKKIIQISTALLILLPIVGLAAATSTSFWIDSDLIGQSGGLATSTSYQLESISSFISSELGSSTNYSENAGFFSNDASNNDDTTTGDTTSSGGSYPSSPDNTLFLKLQADLDEIYIGLAQMKADNETGASPVWILGSVENVFLRGNVFDKRSLRAVLIFFLIILVMIFIRRMRLRKESWR